MDNHIHAMQNTIQHTLTAIAEVQEHLKQIVENTHAERARAEFEFAEIENRYEDVTRKLAALVFDAETARRELVSLCVGSNQQSQHETQLMIDHALDVYTELGQVRESQAQLEVQRDEMGRRLDFMETISSLGTNLLERFSSASKVVDDTNGEVASVLEMRKLQEALAMRTVDLVEEERRRLAAHLHDGPLQHLASLLMKAEAAYRLTSESMELGVALDLRGRLNDVIGSIRQIVFDLRPPLLDDLGLVPALRWYSAQWCEETGIEASVTLVGVEVLLNHTEKVTLFRVVQEALQHASGHTDTTNVSITVTYGACTVTIQVVSNGREPMVADWLERIELGQVGLALCRQRILSLGGEFSISSTESDGTSMNIALPLSRE